MDALQVFLVVVGLVVASAGVYMLIDARNHSASPRRDPSSSIAIAFIGFMIAYKAYAEYNGIDATDVIIMFLFVFALMGLLGIQFFIIDKSSATGKNKGALHC